MRLVGRLKCWSFLCSPQFLIFFLVSSAQKRQLLVQLFKCFWVCLKFNKMESEMQRDAHTGSWMSIGKIRPLCRLITAFDAVVPFGYRLFDGVNGMSTNSSFSKCFCNDGIHWEGNDSVWPLQKRPDRNAANNDRSGSLTDYSEQGHQQCSQNPTCRSIQLTSDSFHPLSINFVVFYFYFAFWCFCAYCFSSSYRRCLEYI